MRHFHLKVTEKHGQQRLGALATTEVAARDEARIERADGHRVEIVDCTGDCFGSRTVAGH